MSDETKIYGMDISHWQGERVPFNTLKNDGVSFIICKATDGAVGIDKDYHDNIDKIKSAGIIPGAYHFYEPFTDGEAQANHFMDTVGDEDCNDIILALDFEKYREDPTVDISNAEKFIDTVLAKYPDAKLLFYSYHAFTSNYNISADSSIRKCKQWIARYGTHLPVIKYGETLFIWQQSQSYKFAGGGQEFDYDIVMVSNEDFNNWINPAAVEANAENTVQGDNTGDGKPASDNGESTNNS